MRVIVPLLAAALVAPAAASAASFRVNTTRARPSSVTANRLAYNADRAGGHWGASYVSRTTTPPGRLDGVNVIGFGWSASGNVAAKTVGWDCYDYEDSRSRVRERCTERDIIINPRLRWEDGPPKPSTNELDLLTVLLHEFGHFAGDPNHRRRCVNSPMVEEIRFGEWWHSRTDFRWFDCGSRSRPRSARASSRAAFRL